jgi:exopolysaccharide biosynthesis polyprenyl glycosylphosphotransferase
MDLTFTALLLPLDALALYAAAISAYALRFSRFVTEVRPILQNVNFTEYVSAATFFVVVWLALFALAGLYSPHPRKAWNELGRIILTCGAGTMVVIATVFFRREIATSRFIILAVLAFSVLYVGLGRLVLRTIRHFLLRFHVGHRLYVIIGDSNAAQDLARSYRDNPVLGLTVVRQFKRWNEETRKAIQTLKNKDALDGIILAEPEMAKEDALDIIAVADEQHLTFRYLADLFAAKFTNIEVLTDSGIPVIEVKRTPLDGWGRIAKRACDILGASFFLILFSPLLLIACLALIIEDGLPVIFQNIRVGEGGREFKLYKLRTMWRKFSIGPQFKDSTKENLEFEKKLIKQKSIKNGPVYKIAADPRVTPIGNFLRRWSIDELPQFWNVIKGDMSIVGPRPHQPREVAGYAPHQRRVFAIRPGITGMAQISGRSDLEFEDEVRLDTWYIENWSLWLDLYIVLKTPFAVLYRKGAY